MLSYTSFPLEMLAALVVIDEIMSDQACDGDDCDDVARAHYMGQAKTEVNVHDARHWSMACAWRLDSV
ncbi:hypothetical protein GCM10008094_08010 [Aidingimonas halophila]|nr:hypothetical protein GCM10008094_08010 [Aidingimonas halophila]